MGVDLKQLSAQLGLSQTTVSRALNGYTDVSPKTRERVAQMATELGYQPNLGARRLAIGRTEAVGIVYPTELDHLGNPNFLVMLAGVSERLEQVGYDLLIAAARERSELRTYERLVRGRRVDGLIVANTKVSDARIDYLREAGLPFVAYGRTAEASGYAWLDDDHESGCRQTAERLVGLGHRLIGMVHAPLDYHFARQRRDGLLRALAEAGLQVRPEHLIEGSMDRRRGYAATQQLLALTEPPTAIMVDHNIGGVGVIHAVLDAGLQPGRDISVIVDGGLPEDTLLNGPSIAMIEHPSLADAGRTMADMLLALIEGAPPDDLQVLRSVSLRDGSSVGPCRVC